MGEPVFPISRWIHLRVSGRACVTRRRGVTLIEMLVVMAITGVLAAIAAPSFGQFTASLQLTSATNSLISSLHLARSEAIKRNTRVALCKTPDGIACAPDGGWEQGWIVFHDINNNGLREPAEPVIQHQQALSAGLRMKGNTTVACYISFIPTGATKLVGGGFQAGTMTVCRPSAATGDARQIILNAAGRPRVQKTWVATCD